MHFASLLLILTVVQLLTPFWAIDLPICFLVHFSMTRWVYPPCPRQSCVSGVGVFVVAPAPFCVVLLCFLLAKRKSGREICVSSLFCLVFVCVWICLELWNQGISQCLHFIHPLLSLLGPSLRAKSAATEGNKKPRKKKIVVLLLILGVPLSWHKAALSPHSGLDSVPAWAVSVPRRRSLINSRSCKPKAASTP